MPKSAVFWMILYAVILLDAGIAAYLLAPAEANAVTALIVPTACAVLMLLCAGASAMLARKRAVGMVGIHVGLVLPVVFAAAFASRAMAASAASSTYAEQRADYRALADAERPPTFEAYLGTLAEPGPDHDKGYLAVTLWRLTGLSGVAFVLILAQRPKPAKRGASAEPSRTD